MKGRIVGLEYNDHLECIVPYRVLDREDGECDGMH